MLLVDILRFVILINGEYGLANRVKDLTSTASEDVLRSFVAAAAAFGGEPNRDIHENICIRVGSRNLIELLKDIC